MAKSQMEELDKLPDDLLDDDPLFLPV